jgi:nucleoid-associated protein YgaU
MGSVALAVLEFDEAVQVPWRPRLVDVSAAPASPRGQVSPRRAPQLSGAPAGRRAHAARAGRTGVSEGAAPGAGVRRGAGAEGARLAPGPPAHAPCPRCTAAGHPPVRLTTRARRLLAGLAVVAAVAVGACLSGVVSDDEPALELVGETSVVVESGDTVWDIARSVAGDDQDVRAVVDAIQRRNDLAGARLVPGQVLVLP